MRRHYAEASYAAAREEAESASARVDTLEHHLERLAMETERRTVEGTSLETTLRQRLSGVQMSAAEAAVGAEARAVRLTGERDAAATELSDLRSAVIRLQAVEVSLRTEAATAQETSLAEIAVAERHIEQLANMVTSLTSASKVGVQCAS